jgi:hypothetical protein
MKKLHDIYYTSPIRGRITPVGFRRGRIAQIARWLHKRIRTRFLYNLGYVEIDTPYNPIIGIVEDVQNGVVRVRLNTTIETKD